MGTAPPGKSTEEVLESSWAPEGNVRRRKVVAASPFHSWSGFGSTDAGATGARSSAGFAQHERPPQAPQPDPQHERAPDWLVEAAEADPGDE